MTKEEFEKFLEQKARATRQTTPIDWEARKHLWLQNLAGFYSTIEDYLAPYREAGKLKVERYSVSLTEEYLGTYPAQAVSVFIGSDKVTLVPVGTLIIGARGRVDMAGSAGKVKFLLTAKHSTGIRMSIRDGENQPAENAPASPHAVPEEFVWKIATPPPKIRFITLAPETFFSALMEVVNG